MIMIVVKVKEAAEKQGVKNAYQFQKRTGFPMPMASRLFKGKWTRADLKTINTICNALGCTPNDILEFTPDEEEN